MKNTFEWDDNKNRLNQSKHGVSFYEAQQAFFDKNRIIAEDSEHSYSEKGYYCFGNVGDAIMTVRFTHRGMKIRIIGAGYWRQGKKIYEQAQKDKLHSEPIGKIKIVTDFLPSPDELAMKEESVKVTLSLSKASVEYFKEIAKKKHTPYQKMIRTLLDKYAAHYQH